MNNIRDLEEDKFGYILTIAEWEETCAAGGFIDYDGFGYFCNPDKRLELYGFDVFPSLIGHPAYEQRKVEWTHINWFNK